MSKVLMYSIPESTLNMMLKYLGEKPFTEVSQIISIIQQTSNVITEPTDTEKVHD